MKFLRDIMDGIAPHFEKDGKLVKFFPAFEAIDNALFTPGETTAGASHVRDGLDLKRIMMTVWLCAWLPALVGSYFVGLNANEAMQAAGISAVEIEPLIAVEPVEPGLDLTPLVTQRLNAWQ